MFGEAIRARSAGRRPAGAAARASRALEFEGVATGARARRVGSARSFASPSAEGKFSEWRASRATASASWPSSSSGSAGRAAARCGSGASAANGWSVARIRESGVASIPDDPLALALIPGLTVRQNLVLGGGRRYRRGLDFDWPRLVCRHAAKRRQAPIFRLRRFDVRALVLSGGNQQRVVLTREFAHGPKLIVALYPTRGLDARSAEAVRDRVPRRARRPALRCC